MLVNLESNFWNSQLFQKTNERREKTRALRIFFSCFVCFLEELRILIFVFLDLLTFSPCLFHLNR